MESEELKSENRKYKMNSDNYKVPESFARESLKHIEAVIVYAHTIDTSPTLTPLVLKKRPEYLAGMLNLPGGKLEVGESPLEGALRELKEETGLDEVQEYDPAVYYPSEVMGKIIGNEWIIHCVRVPVCARQPLVPAENEDEEIKWFMHPGFLNAPNLMPNLRLVIPLMQMEARNWIIEDKDGDWRAVEKHRITFGLDDGNPNTKTEVYVKGGAHYERPLHSSD